MTTPFKIFFASLLFLVTSCGNTIDFPLFKGKTDFSQLVFPDKDTGHFNNEYLVSFKVGGNSLEALTKMSLASKRKKVNQMFYQSMVESGKVADIEFISEVNISDPKQKSKNIFERFIELGLPAKSFNLDKQKSRISLVKFKSHKSAVSTLKKWADENKIWYAEPNWNSTLSDAADDEYFSNLDSSYESEKDNKYWLEDTKISESLDLINSLSSEVKEELLANPPVIAILDSGVDVEHESVADQIYLNDSFQNKLCANDYYGCNTSVDFQKGLLGDGDVFPVLTSGYSETCPDGDEKSTCLHGTHVAGIAAGKPTDSADVYGFCPFCKIMVLKVVKGGTDASGAAVSQGISDSSILRALQYVAAFTQNGERVVRVINSSFGKYQKSRSVALMVRLLSEQDRGVLLIGAASNEDSMSRSYPAALSDAIAVSAVNDSHIKASFSNSGTWVDIAAPGRGIISAEPNGLTESEDGTSMAAPIVSGIAGLVIAMEPSLTAPQLKNRLLKSANPLIYDVPYNNTYYFPKLSDSSDNTPLLGTGLVDSYAAITNSTYNIAELIQNDRVTSGCAMLGSSFSDNENTSSIFIAFFIFLITLPLLVRFVKSTTSKNGK
ncbi:S8 family serine peptidase [bacterium]|nr:S8 family serine peptidase [bacterium]